MRKIIESTLVSLDGVIGDPQVWANDYFDKEAQADALPPALATGILKIIPLVVTDATRDARFAAPVTVSPLASPGDRLIALLGRSPQAPSAT
jgi:hypothetical protein